MHVKNLNFRSKPDARVLMLSQRQLSTHVSHSTLFEFEDIICEVDSVDMLAPIWHPPSALAKIGFKLSSHITKSNYLAHLIQSAPDPVTLDREYDLGCMVFEHPLQVLAIRSIKNWREKCKVAICYMVEIWEEELQECQPILKFLKEFDHVILGHYHSTEEISQLTERPCTYIPGMVDAIKFCPYPNPPARSIDASYIGRRSAITHAALMNWAAKGNHFYNYDTARQLSVTDYREHRILLANQLKRSRYFFANKAKINLPEIRGDQSEFGYRFFEGAAAGTVMLGDYPRTEIFQQYFDWKDAVIRIPFDMPDIADILADLDNQPERLERIRQDNVVNSLLRYDWLYIWKEILQHANLESTPAMAAREAYLENLAQMVKANPVALRR